jgi:hypothetical protein
MCGPHQTSSQSPARPIGTKSANQLATKRGELMWRDFVLSSFLFWETHTLFTRFLMSGRGFLSEFCITLQLHQP